MSNGCRAASRLASLALLACVVFTATVDAFLSPNPKRRQYGRLRVVVEKSRGASFRELGLDRTATPEEVKQAYRQIARTCHPDIDDSAEANAKFQRASEAYAVLTGKGEEEMQAEIDLIGLGRVVFGAVGEIAVPLAGYVASVAAKEAAPFLKSGAAQVGAVASTVSKGGRGMNNLGDAMKTAARNFDRKEIERKVGMVSVTRAEHEAVAQGYANGAAAAEEALASAALEKEKAEKAAAETEGDIAKKTAALEKLSKAEAEYKAEAAELSRSLKKAADDVSVNNESKEEREKRRAKLMAQIADLKAQVDRIDRDSSSSYMNARSAERNEEALQRQLTTKEGQLETAVERRQAAEAELGLCLGRLKEHQAEVERVAEFQATMEGQLEIALENQRAADEQLSLTIEELRELEARLGEFDKGEEGE